MQLLLVVGLNVAGYAAKQGPSQVVLWLLAMVLFYLPLAAVVIKLSRAIPLEGGVYQWVKQGASPFAGYMAGWSLTIYGICFFGSYGSQLADGFAYAGGPTYSWMGTSPWFALLLMVLLCGLAFVLNVRGLHITKWLNTTGSLLTILVFLILLFLLIKAFVTSKPATAAAFSFALPGFSVLTLNVFTKMALFALSGFDQCAIFTEECRKPGNDVARSVLIAAPLIALMYILVTSTMLTYIAPANIDLAAPVSQVAQIGLGSTGIGRVLTMVTIGSFSFMLIATLILVVGMIARLPMVAGWDGILPAWWSELHPRFRNPSKAIAAVAASLVLMGALSLLGAHNQEAVQVLYAVGYGSYCLMYLLMFGAVVFGFRSASWRPGVAIRLAALAAFFVVLVCLGFEVVPIGEVASPLWFATKVTVALFVTNGLGAYLYWRGVRRAQRLLIMQES
jgi:glutamate:GABA antiporter